MNAPADGLGLRLQDGELRLSEHQDGWAAAFEREAARLRPVLPAGSELEHIGSTAVPGLLAKPLLDLALGCPAEIRLKDVGTVLEALGYRFRDDAGAAGGLVYLRESGGLRTHTLHLVRLDDPQWGAWLALRDLLRGSREARQRYAKAKATALRHAQNRQEYTRLKTTVVEGLLSGR